ncbi:MAG: zinc-binding dehydrogenase [Promethearchaeota archaeon]
MRGLMFDRSTWRLALTKLFRLEGLTTRYRDDWPTPQVDHPTKVRVKTLLAGICGTDLHQARADVSTFVTAMASPRNPFPVGHEALAVVDEVGAEAKEQRDLEVGDRVVYFPVATCEHHGFAPCASCRAGDYEACLCLTGRGDGSGREAIFGGRGKFGGYGGGGFCEFLVGFAGQFHPVPRHVPDDVAVLVEPFGIGVHAVARNPPADDQFVVVVGAGTIGLMVVAAARALGCRCTILVLARHPFQADLARRLGADHVVVTKGLTFAHVLERVTRLAGGTVVKPSFSKPAVYGAEGADVVYDSVATEGSLDESMRLLRHGGKLVVVGQGFSVTKRVDWALLSYKELRVVGALMHGMVSHGGRVVHAFELALELASKDPGRLAGLVTHRFPIEEHREAFRVARNKAAHGSVKVAFDWRSN